MVFHCDFGLKLNSFLFFLNNLKNGFCFDIRSAYWTFLEIELNTKVELSNMGTWLCEK